MILTIKKEIFRDKETGVHYSKEFSVKPVVLISEAGRAKSRGVLLEPYCPFLEFDDCSQEEVEEKRARFGYDANVLSQDLFVTEEQFKARFESIGVQTENIDMEALRKHYQEEGVDFDNPRMVAHHARKAVVSSGGHGLNAAILFHLLDSYEKQVLSLEKLKKAA